MDTFDILQNVPLKAQKEQLYNVEAILDKQYVGKVLKYKVKWEGYDLSECTWEPFKNLEVVSHLIKQFEKDLTLKQNKSQNSENKITQKKDKENLKKRQKSQSKIKDKSPQKIVKQNKESNLEIEQEQQQQLIHVQNQINDKNNQGILKYFKNISQSNEIENVSKILNQIQPITQQNGIQVQNLINDNLQGSFEKNDEIDYLLNGKIENGELLFEVVWQKRNNEEQLLNSWISNSILRNNDPDSLLNFYEKKLHIKYVNQQNK